jgi:hypothetical protein
MSKGAAAPSVSMVFQGKSYGYQNDVTISNPKFWNNYPFLVLAEEGKKLDSLILLRDTDGKEQSLLDIVGQHYAIVFRYSGRKYEDSVIDTCLYILKKYGDSILIINSGEFQTGVESSGFNHVYRTTNAIAKNIEKANLPYFFLLTPKGTIEDIFIPRKEIPELTERYLQSLKNRIDL